MPKYMLWKKGLVLIVTLLFIGVSVVSSIATNAVLEKPSTMSFDGNTLFVGGSGPGNYTKIQDAIDNASDGDTVFVFSGTYYETIVIDKSINLIGQHKDSTIIDGSETGDVITITVNMVNISGFTIKNSGYQNSGIYGGEKGFFNIVDNRLIDNFKGIKLQSSSNPSFISDNYITNSFFAITISMSSKNHNISGNILTGNSGYGLYFYRVDNADIYNNRITNNEWGLMLVPNCNYNVITDNLFEDNSEYGIKLAGIDTYGNFIYHNNFIDSSPIDAESNTWDNGYPSGGNYWSGYTGEDNYHGPNQDIPGSDGIGDTPYFISGGSNQDNYPFMNPLSLNNPPNPPSNPDPEDGETTVRINADLSWTGGDPDGDTVTYDVYFGSYPLPPLVSAGQSDTTYDPGTMDFETTYYWKIVAEDEWGATTSGPIWSFTTLSGSDNHPPYEPSDPIPEDEATDVDVDADLGWTGGDPDPEDTVVYDVYLEANNPDPTTLVSDDQTETTFDPGTLEYGTIYYWKIHAKDNHNRVTKGPIWHFTTEDLQNEPPDAPTIDGPTSGKPGVFYTYNITSTDPDGNDVSYYIKWGDGSVTDWTTFQASGPPGYSESHTWSEQGTYTIEAKTKDMHGAESDWGTLTVTMPRNRNAINSLFLRFLEQFPIIQKIFNFLNI